MKKLILSALLAITMCSPCVCQYNPDGLPDSPNGGANPDAGSVPINTGLYLLLAAGLFYGVIKISKAKKTNSDIYYKHTNSKWTDHYLGKFSWYRKYRNCTWYKHQFTKEAFLLSSKFVGTFWTVYGKVNKYSEVVSIECW